MNEISFISSDSRKGFVKLLAGLLLVILGVATAFYGRQSGIDSLITLGIGGIFLGIVVLTFVEGYVKHDVSKASLSSYLNLASQLLESLEIKSKGIYIPPRGALKEGRVFVPLHEDGSFSLPELQEDTLFVTNVDKEGEIGLLFLPPGYELVKLFEEYMETRLDSIPFDALEGQISGALQGLELASGIRIKEDGETYMVEILGPRSTDACNKYQESMLCEQVGCSLCSSVVLSLATSTGEALRIEDVSKSKRGISLELSKINLSNLGGAGK